MGIKSGLSSGEFCHHTVSALLSSRVVLNWSLNSSGSEPVLLHWLAHCAETLSPGTHALDGALAGPLCTHPISLELIRCMEPSTDDCLLRPHSGSSKTGLTENCFRLSLQHVQPYLPATPSSHILCLDHGTHLSSFLLPGEDSISECSPQREDMSLFVPNTDLSYCSQLEPSVSPFLGTPVYFPQSCEVDF